MEFVPDSKFTEKLIDGYSKYFNYDTNQQEKSIEEAIEENLTHLEEFCTTLDLIRNENNENLVNQMPDLNVKIKKLNDLYIKVDKLVLFFDEIKKTINSVENELIKAENKFNSSNKLSHFLSRFINNKNENITAHSDDNFSFPNIFDTKSFFD